MRIRIWLVTALGLAVLGGCSSTGESAAPPQSVADPVVTVPEPALQPAVPTVTSPVYGSLENDTPGNATASLIRAFDDRDFFEAFFLFDTDAQQLLGRLVNNLNFVELRRGASLLPRNLILGDSEHTPSTIPQVARFLHDAAKTDNLLIDLAGAELMSSEIETVDGQSIATVELLLTDGSAAKVRLTQAAASNWRVNQIATGGVDFDDSDRVFLDATCGRQRVVVLPGVECPSDEPDESGLQDKIDRITAEAGDDINKQIAAAREIQALVDQSQRNSDEGLCAVMQGNALLVDETPSPVVVERAQALLDSTCPGSIELLNGRTEVPPSGGVGENTRYAMLDLSTPEAAVQTFGELFDNQSFSLLFLSLDTRAQSIVANGASRLDVSPFAHQDVLQTWDGIGGGQHVDTSITLFHRIWAEASATDQHILDLGLVDVGTATSVTWDSGPDRAVPAHIVDVTVIDSGETFYFLMLESPSGRWRVRQVADSRDALELAENVDRVFINSDG